jgi:ABC-type transport system substrate-binding protein
MDRDLQRTAAVVRSDLASAGIEMHIATVSYETYLNRLKAHSFDASVISVSTDALFDPIPFFHSQAIDNNRNFGSFSSAEADALLDGFRDALTSENRLAYVQKIATMLRKEHPMTFTFRPHASAIIKNEIQGVVIRDGWFDERFLWRSEPTPGAER